MTKEEIFALFEAHGNKVMDSAKSYDELGESLIRLITEAYTAQAYTIALLLPMLEADERLHKARNEADQSVVEALRGCVSVQLGNLLGRKIQIQAQTVH